MDYEIIKNEFIKLKSEELEYINNISGISSNRKLLETEKLEIYRNFKKYELKLKELLKNLWLTLPEIEENKLERRERKNAIVLEIDLDKNYLSSASFSNENDKKDVLENLGIDVETLKFKLTLYDLWEHQQYGIGFNIIENNIQNNQKLIENPIYVFVGYYDAHEDCYGPSFGEYEDYIYGIYENIWFGHYDKKKILKRNMENFEKNKMIVHSKRYVDSYEIRKIFEEELLSDKNKTLNDCVVQTKNRVEELNYTRSPEYKEKVLLDRIYKLYEKVRGEFIKKEIMYSANFLKIISETYKLPNENIVKKEKIIKNGGKDSVIIIATTENNEYIITFQNRIKDEIIAEFPSGYIENDEDVIEAAKRELKEETGYITDDLFIVDKAYTSLGIDNSVTYIVVANNCIKTDEKKVSSTELVTYELFSMNELDYLIDKNIMNGSMNKLAYYNLINNIDEKVISYVSGNKKISKKLRKKSVR